ncbi:MAG: S8 family peptidase [Nitrososphaera sp.]
MSTTKRLLVATHVFLIFSIVFLAGTDAAFADHVSKADRSSRAEHDSERVRVIAESEQEAASALAHGCMVVREAKGMKALLCDSDVASSLDLKEDIKVFKADSGANWQIGANIVRKSGNSGAGRIIVVLDTGYNYNHPELSSSYLGGKDFSNNDNDPFDDNGHGSHVAGLITADGIKSSARGAAPKAAIISGKVLGQDGSGNISDIIAAIYWAVDGPDGEPGTADDFKADAISMSLATPPPYVFKTFCNSVLPSLTSAIKYAVNHRVVVVVAAGNYGSQGVSMPGCVTYSTTVGAVSGSDKIASFSGRGKGVDVTAPGVSLESAWLGTSYVKASGTSMATPLVSATVALVKHDHPSYSHSQVQAALFNTAKDLGVTGKDYAYGHGRVVASAAVDYP